MKETDQTNKIHFGWDVPQLADGTTVTVSRAQFSHTADRLGVLSTLSRATTAEEFARNLQGIFSARNADGTKKDSLLSRAARAAGEEESPDAQQRRQFIAMIFGEKDTTPDGTGTGKPGLVSKKERKKFVRRMNGVSYEPRDPLNLKTTREGLVILLERDDLSSRARAKITKIIEEFDQQAITAYIDSEGDINAKPTQTYKEMPAVTIEGEVIPTGRIIGWANMIAIHENREQAKKSESNQGNDTRSAVIKFFADHGIQPDDQTVDQVVAIFPKGEDEIDIVKKKFSAACKVLDIAPEERTTDALKKKLGTLGVKKVFNNSGMVVASAADAYTEEKVVQLDIQQPPKRTEGEPGVSPTDARNIFEQTFSAVNRSAGSRLAGVPATMIDRNITGMEIKDRPDLPAKLRIDYEYGPEKGDNTFALYGTEVRVGQPYAERMEAASILVTQAVDTVSRKASEYIEEQATLGRLQVPVEEAADHILANMDAWLAQPDALTYDGPRARSHLQMDYFFLPAREVREKVIADARKNRGFLSEEAKALLNDETQKGNLRLAIFDISGGAGGTGISEFLAQQLGHETSGLTSAYIHGMEETYKAVKGQEPQTVAIAPRRADLTLLAFEYLPLLKELEEQGKDAHIVLAEDLEDALDEWNANGSQGGFRVKSLLGEDINPDLVAKRFTFLGAGKKRVGDRGHIRTTLPEHMMITPHPASRITASDKRVNSRILDILQPQLEEIGLEIIPTASIPVVDRVRIEALDAAIENANDDEERASRLALRNEYIDEKVTAATQEIIAFAKAHKEEWPEIGHLGMVLKVDDKRPGREGKGGEIVSAYGVYAGMTEVPVDSRTAIERQVDEAVIFNAEKTPQQQAQKTAKEEKMQYMQEMLRTNVRKLVEKGTLSVLVQPNLMTAFGEGDMLMETKMLVYTKPTEE